MKRLRQGLLLFVFSWVGAAYSAELTEDSVEAFLQQLDEAFTAQSEEKIGPLLSADFEMSLTLKTRRVMGLGFNYNKEEYLAEVAKQRREGDQASRRFQYERLHTKITLSESQADVYVRSQESSERNGKRRYIQVENDYVIRVERGQLKLVKADVQNSHARR